jgi:uncharacterized protein (TIGR00159 family)
MHLVAIITNLRFQDVLDILFLTVVAYHLYLWFQGTKAFKALVGLFVLGIIFTLARTWGLFLTTWVFQILWQVLVILLIILFQSEIRQALEKVNPLQAFGLRKRGAPGKWIKGLGEAVFSMAGRKMGALIVIERADAVAEWVTGGQPLEGDPSPELLLSIFQKESPLHDGAVLIRDGHVSHVAGYLPLSSEEKLPKEWGTRHRAAMGLSERSDALVVALSEERGEVSVFRSGEVIPVASEEDFSRLVLETTTPQKPAKGTHRQRARSRLLNQWRAKAGTLFLVVLIWLLLAGQQNFEVALTVPLEVKNLPETLVIVTPVNPKVRLRVRGLRKDASTLSEKNVRAAVDLSTADTGRSSFSITRDDILLPIGSVQIVQIEPSQVTFSFQRKS